LEGGGEPTVLKVSVVMGTGIPPKDSSLLSVQWLGNLHRQDECRKKKFQGFPAVFTFENFKKGLLGDMSKIKY
jgi:hypothetical protein